jgi:transcription elongation factor GreA
MSNNTIYLTQEWLVKLQNELEHLKSVKRVEIAAKLKEAISFWDLSENSEYEDARNEQAQVELRISDLQWQLKVVEIIKETGTKWEKVSMWSVVEIQDIETKDKAKYKIVGSTESDILAELPTISNESLVWKTLLWKKKSEKVKIESHGNVMEYKIVSIK